LGLTLASAGAACAQQQQEAGGALGSWRSAQDVGAVCALAPFVPERLDPALGGVGLPREYLRARSALGRRAFEVDLDPRGVEFAYDEGAQLLTLVAQPRYAVLDGSVVLELVGEPLVGFSLAEDEAHQLALGCKSQSVTLRLRVVLDGLEDPARPFCAVSDEGVTRVRVRLLQAQLWRSPKPLASQGSGPPTEPQVIEAAKLELPEAQARFDALLSSRPTVAAREAEVLGGALSPSEDAGLRELERLREEAEDLALPCHQASVALGGPSTGALVVDVVFGPGGKALAVTPTVEATGSSSLTACVVRALQYLEAPEAEDGPRLRLRLFFERA
jgi:hypothetical protein